MTNRLLTVGSSDCRRVAADLGPDSGGNIEDLTDESAADVAERPVRGRAPLNRLETDTFSYRHLTADRTHKGVLTYRSRSSRGTFSGGLGGGTARRVTPGVAAGTELSPTLSLDIASNLRVKTAGCITNGQTNCGLPVHHQSRSPSVSHFACTTC
jgi:hypothetical protein